MCQHTSHGGERRKGWILSVSVGWVEGPIAHPAASGLREGVAVTPSCMTKLHDMTRRLTCLVEDHFRELCALRSIQIKGVALIHNRVLEIKWLTERRIHHSHGGDVLLLFEWNHHSRTKMITMCLSIIEARCAREFTCT